MRTITEEVVIRNVVAERAPAWTVGLTGSFNPRLYFIAIHNPQTGNNQFFPAEAFLFEPTCTKDKPHVLTVMEAQREWAVDELSYPDWALQEALMFPNKDPRKP